MNDASPALTQWTPFSKQPPERLILKLGSQILVDDDGTLAIDRLASYVRQCAKLKRQGCQIVIVSSGSVALGKQALGLTGELNAINKRACAALGQAHLVQTYENLFQHYDIPVAQVLLNSRHFEERWHYVHMSHTLEALLDFNVVPIVNENDTLADPATVPATQTASFDDNDSLASLVAVKLDASGLVILSNIEGLYTDNPQVNPDARLLTYISNVDELLNVKTTGQSKMGRGGMASKLEAAKTAALCGVPTLIGSGLLPDSILNMIRYNGPVAHFPGTYFAAMPKSDQVGVGYKRWLALASGYSGVLTINDGAAQALKHRGASLLAVGIVKVEGDFLADQVVNIQNASGDTIARGITRFSSSQLQQLSGRKSHEFDAILGHAANQNIVVHRDKLVVF